MTSSKKHKYICARIRYWRIKLRIDDKWKIFLEYKPNPEDPKEGTDYAEINIDDYYQARMVIYEELMGISDPEQFRKIANSSINHEMQHVIMYPLTAYCNNMFRDDEGKQAELTRLEEQVVCHHEKVWCGEIS